VPGANHFDQQTLAGLHYHLDYLTPYWDPEGGFRVDANYATGIPILGEHEAFNRVDAQFSIVKGLPDWLGPLSQTRLAARIYGAAGLPNNGEYFTLGGGDLFRGFDLSQRQGSVVWVGSLEWRVPIIQRVTWDCCDHFVGVRNIGVAAFYDVGDAYVRGHSMGPVAHALGAGLRVDLAWISLIERTTLRFDVAQTINSSSPVQFWFGVRVPF
jgi:hemolysin activation/secretion protein